MLNKRSFLISIFAVFIIISGFIYYEYRQRYPETDNAYIQANMIHIAPEVSGKITTLAVENNEVVKAGQLLLAIDESKYQLAVQAAQAELALAQQNHAANQEAVKVAKAQVMQRQAEQELAQKNLTRIEQLLAKKLVPAIEGDEASTKLSVAKSALQAAQEQQRQAEQQLGELGTANAGIKKAQTQLAQAELDLANTKIYAKTDGTINNLEIRQGDLVHANQDLFVLINRDNWWVNANFKETQLTRIQKGQTATIRVDLYPGLKLTGQVDSISSGSGATFSLLPAENASGNWVKVTQRFQVKVLIAQPAADKPLRVGASASVQIDTQTNG